MTKKILFSIAIVASLGACQVTQKGREVFDVKKVEPSVLRKIASEPTKLPQKRSRKEQSFLKFFKELEIELTKIESADSSNPQQSEALNKILFAQDLIADAKKSFQYLFEFDEIVQANSGKGDSCIKKQEAEAKKPVKDQKVINCYCKSDEEALRQERDSSIPAGDKCLREPMKTDGYRKLLAYRHLFSEQKDELKYYYMRLLDLANSTDLGNTGQPRFVYQASAAQLKRYSDQEKLGVASVARSALNNWAQLLRARLSVEALNKNRSVDSVIEYGLAADLADVRQDAIDSYYERVGKESKASTIIPLGYVENLKKAHEQVLSEQAKKAHIKRMKSVKDRTEIENSVKEIKKNEAPQSREVNSLSINRFVNINGRKFTGSRWALTYDDGPHRSRTSAILDHLADFKVNTTFFWQASNVNARTQAVIDRAKRLGHGLAHHSYTHPLRGIPSMSSASQRREIDGAKRVLESAYGVPVNYFRFPGGTGATGSRYRSTQRLVAKAGMIHFYWTVDSHDWRDRNPSQILRNITGQMRGKQGGIILVHDIHQTTVEATPRILRHFANSSSRLVPLQTMVQETENPKWTVNGGTVSDSPVEPDDPPDDPVNEFRPHNRRIISSDGLNVRASRRAAGNSNFCGRFLPGRVVRVLHEIDGWYGVNIDNDVPDDEVTSHTCRHQIKWISGSARFSEEVGNDVGDDDFNSEFRMITANFLNIRSKPETASTSPCGIYRRGQIVRVLGMVPDAAGRNRRWYRVDTGDSPEPKPIWQSGDSRHRCGNRINYISAGATFSELIE